jgi:hypothetical protein
MAQALSRRDNFPPPPTSRKPLPAQVRPYSVLAMVVTCCEGSARLSTPLTIAFDQALYYPLLMLIANRFG